MGLVQVKYGVGGFSRPHGLKALERSLARRTDHTKEELKALVIAATIELIEQRASIKVTARQIAQHIGYAPGTLYLHFQNLDEIFLHVNAQTLSELRLFLVENIASAKAGQAKLVAMGLAYFEFAQINPQRFQLMFTPRLPRGVTPPEYLQSEIDELFGLLSACLREVADADVKSLKLGARALWSGVHGSASLALADQLFIDVPNAEPEIVKMLVSQFAQSWEQQYG